MHEGIAVLGRQGGVGLAFEEEIDHVLAAGDGGEDERGGPEPVAGVYVLALVEEFLDRLEVAEAGGDVEGMFHLHADLQKHVENWLVTACGRELGEAGAVFVLGMGIGGEGEKNFEGFLFATEGGGHAGGFALVGAGVYVGPVFEEDLENLSVSPPCCAVEGGGVVAPPGVGVATFTYEIFYDGGVSLVGGVVHGRVAEAVGGVDEGALFDGGDHCRWGVSADGEEQLVVEAVDDFLSQVTPEDLPSVALFVAKLDNCFEFVQTAGDRYAFALVGQVEGFEQVEVERAGVADRSGE